MNYGSPSVALMSDFNLSKFLVNVLYELGQIISRYDFLDNRWANLNNGCTDINLIWPNFPFGKFSVAKQIIVNGGAIRPRGLLFQHHIIDGHHFILTLSLHTHPITSYSPYHFILTLSMLEKFWMKLDYLWGKYDFGNVSILNCVLDRWVLYIWSTLGCVGHLVVDRIF